MSDQTHLQEGATEGVQSGREPEQSDVVDVVDIEVFARENRCPPRARTYRFRIDRDHFTVDHRIISGGELFRLAQKSPEKWRMHQKLHGGQMKEVKVGDKVDLGEPGVERFVTMELTQGDGEHAGDSTSSTATTEAPPRRQFRLPEDDETYLNSLDLRWEAIVDSGVRWVLIFDHPLPPGYTGKTVTIAIRIEGGYPPSKLDMAYFLPHLARADGKSINALSTQVIDGGTYQRWSRHYAWREGIDSLAVHHLHIKDWLEAEPKR